jgi:large subunit ribosomal protein L15
MKLHELSPGPGSRKSRKRVARGVGSGHGKTSCRGSKGQNSRTGSGSRIGFEGGQMPIQRRLPKRGFANIFKKIIAIINIDDLSKFESGSLVDEPSLIKAGLVKGRFDGIKLLGNGEIGYPLIIKLTHVSESAKQKIESSGGRIE